MCGITGYIGTQEAAPLLVEGLHRLEYRGYDSAGLAIENDQLYALKTAGRVSELEKQLTEHPIAGSAGIAHTRWATHGPPTQANAHPHLDCSGEIAVVHNGIIENAETLKTKLQELGHTFQSETDTEVLAHLIEEAWEDNLERAVAAALSRVEGTYGIAVLSIRDPGKIVAAQHGAPLLVGVPEEGEQGWFVASDVAAVLGHTREVVYLEDGELAVVEREGFQTFQLGGQATLREIEKEISHVDWELEEIQKQGYKHYMEKEIFEQPDALRDAMRGRLLGEEGTSRLGGLRDLEEILQTVDRIVIVACGTSWHAGMVGEYMLEKYAGIPVEVEYASEFRYRSPVLEENTLVLALSQSGETADTLAALREARRQGRPVMGIVNVVGSTIARETDAGVYLHVGPEIGVASTKAFTSQLAVLGLLTLKLARRRGRMSSVDGRQFVQALRKLPEQAGKVLQLSDRIEQISREYYENEHALYLGRGFNFPVALEGALKLKEVSYLHAEGYPAAEMKHGPIALIDEDMPVVVVAPQDGVFEKVKSNIEEIRTRGGRIITISTDQAEGVERLSDHLLRVPATMDLLQPILTVLPLQLLAYHIAVLRGCDVDKPRNLAKSVTVE